jgi:hypothetical protein
MVLAVAAGAVVESAVGVSVVFLSPPPQEANNKVIAMNKIRPVKEINLFILVFFLIKNKQGRMQTQKVRTFKYRLFKQQVFFAREFCPGQALK